VSADSFYALKTTTLSGQPAELSQYAGKVALVVNVASQCGLTPQYAGLQKLYDELKGKGFVVLGFPSNDFGGQERLAAGDRGLLQEKLRRHCPDVPSS
jgi:glutathione peroxidase